MRGFDESTWPGAWFMPANRRRSSLSRSLRIGATTMKLDCGVIPDSDDLRELQGEVNQRLLVPIHLPKVEARRDHPNLVANPLGDQRRVGVINRDAFFLIHPTGIFVDGRNDRIEP